MSHTDECLEAERLILKEKKNKMFLETMKMIKATQGSEVASKKETQEKVISFVNSMCGDIYNTTTAKYIIATQGDV